MKLKHNRACLRGRRSIEIDKFNKTAQFIVRSMGFGEFYFNRGLQRLYTGTCIILQKTINGFLCLLIVFLKGKTHQSNLKDVIKLNRNLP